MNRKCRNRGLFPENAMSCKKARWSGLGMIAILGHLYNKLPTNLVLFPLTRSKTFVWTHYLSKWYCDEVPLACAISPNAMALLCSNRDRLVRFSTCSRTSSMPCWYPTPDCMILSQEIGIFPICLLFFLFVPFHLGRISSPCVRSRYL
jgi:hypothetical protein